MRNPRQPIPTWRMEKIGERTELPFRESSAQSGRMHLGLAAAFTHTRHVFRCKNQNSKFFFRHLHGDLNLDEIKNTLRLLPVNRETNLMNLIRLQSDDKLLQ